MVVFKAQMIKYFKSISTWIILVIAAVILLSIGVILPMSFINTGASNANQEYQLFSTISATSIGVSLSLVSSVFAAFKAAQIYKSEIEDGTFLVTLSKPITRTRIVFEKWIALVVIVVLYVSILIILYDLGIVIFDVGDQIAGLNIPTLSSVIFQIGGILFLVILLLTMLFSSISLIISTKIGVASTVAVTSFLGILIPITGFIPTFTISKTNSLISNQDILELSNAPVGKNLESINMVLGGKDLEQVLNGAFEISQDISNKINDPSNNVISGLSFKTGENNAYNNLFFLDINYQLQLISTYSSDILVNQAQKQALAISGQSSDSPDSITTGKVKVLDNDVQTEEFVEKLKNSITFYKNLVESDEYNDFFNNVISFIKQNWKIDKNYEFNLNANIDTRFEFYEELFTKVGVNNFFNFLFSPIRSTINNANLAANNEALQKLQQQLITQKNLSQSIGSLDLLFSIRALLDFQRPLSLIIRNDSIVEYFNTTIDGLALRGSQVFTSEDAKEEIAKSTEIEKFYNENLNLNLEDKNAPNLQVALNLAGNTDEILLANLSRMLKTAEGNELSNKLEQISFESYANREALTAIYAIIALLLAPLSFYIVRKQDVR